MNMEVDEPLMKEWVVRSNKTPTQQADFTTIANRSTLSMTKSMASRTNNFLSRHKDSIESALFQTLNRQVAKYRQPRKQLGHSLQHRGSQQQQHSSQFDLAYGDQGRNDEDDQVVMMETTPTPKADEKMVNNSLKIRVLARNASTAITNKKLSIKTAMNNAQNTYGSDEEDEGEASNSVGRGGRGRSPAQPSQKVMSSLSPNPTIHKRRYKPKLQYFEDAHKEDLQEKMVQSRTILEEFQKEGRPNYDFMPVGVKTFNAQAKNANSVGDYHILSNLTNKQHHDDQLAYDGKRKESDVKVTSY